MGMVFCRGCGTEIHDTAVSCPKCGAKQQVGKQTNAGETGSLWPSITSLVIGIICLLAMADDTTAWDEDMLVALIGLGLLGFGFGAYSIANQNQGKGMAITGVILGLLSALIGIGNLS